MRNSSSTVSTDTRAVAEARLILLQGRLAEGLAIIEPASDQGDDIAAFILAQVLAFQGDWQRVRNLSARLLKQPFLFDPYHEVMQLFALSAIFMKDWEEANHRLASVRTHLDSLLDMSAEMNGFAEAFNRFESYIRSEGKGKLPFRIVSPVNYASMTKDEYARLCSLSLRTASSPSVTLTFDQLDENRKHHYHLWKALYDEDLERALTLFHEQGDDIRVFLGETLQLAQLLMADKQDDYAWEILKPKLLARQPILSHEIVWLELLWDPKTRALMTKERCLDLLTSKRASGEESDAAKISRERDRLSSFCRLAGCLTEEAVHSIEEQVQNDPDNLDLRLKLIGAFSRYDAANLARKKPHINWLIEKHPGSPMIEDLLHYLFLDKATNEDDFDELRQKWLDAVEKDPDNTRVLLNAALMLGVDDKALAEEMLVRAQLIEPDNFTLAERLYELNAFQVSLADGKRRELHAREALKQVGIIEKLSSERNAGTSSGKVAGRASGIGSGIGRGMGTVSGKVTVSELTLLSRRAWFTFEIDDKEGCRERIEEMLKLAEIEGFTRPYRLLAAIIRGRLALKEGDSETAIQYLMSTLPLEPYNHFRGEFPLLTLAHDLCSAGHLPVLVEYMELCREKWPAQEVKILQQFLEDLQAGHPYVPAVRL